MKELIVQGLADKLSDYAQDLSSQNNLETLLLSFDYNVERDDELRAALRLIVLNCPNLSTLKLRAGGYRDPKITTKSILPLLIEVFTTYTPPITHLHTEFTFHKPIPTSMVVDLANLIPTLVNLHTFKLKTTLIGREQNQTQTFSSKALCDSLLNAPAVTDISFNTTLAAEQQQDVLKMLAEKSKMTAFELSGTPLNTETATTLCNILQAKPDFVALTLSNAQLEASSLEILLPLTQQIESLDLSNNYLSLINFTTIALSLRDAKLTRLNLEKTNLNDEALLLLVAGIDLSSHLQVVNLRANALTEQSGAVIANLIQKHTGLKELYLGGNKLGCNAFERIVATLPDNSSLDILDLANNNSFAWRDPWKQGGIIHSYAIVLGRNSTEKSIEKEGYVALAKVLPNIHVKKLMVDQESPQDIGLNALRQAIPESQARELFCASRGLNGGFYNSHLLNHLYGIRSQIPEDASLMGVLHMMPPTKKVRTDESAACSSSAQVVKAEDAPQVLATASSSPGLNSFAFYVGRNVQLEPQVTSTEEKNMELDL